MHNLDCEILATLVNKGAVYCHFKENQIILYESHVPSGIYLITMGDVLVYVASRKVKIRTARHIVYGENILIFPSMQNLNRKSSFQAKALRDCKALFIPRSIVLNNKSLIKMIEECQMPLLNETNQTGNDGW